MNEQEERSWTSFGLGASINSHENSAVDAVLDFEIEREFLPTWPSSSLAFLVFFFVRVVFGCLVFGEKEREREKKRRQQQRRQLQQTKKKREINGRRTDPQKWSTWPQVWEILSAVAAGPRRSEKFLGSLSFFFCLSVFDCKRRTALQLSSPTGAASVKAPEDADGSGWRTRKRRAETNKFRVMAAVLDGVALTVAAVQLRPPYVFTERTSSAANERRCVRYATAIEWTRRKGH